MRARRASVPAGALALAILLSNPAPSHAVTRTCGTDPVANTANVLCASPSGPCDATSVVVSAAIEVVDRGCVFDLGGRALTFQKKLEMTGRGFIEVVDAGDITLTSTAQLKARGDFVKVNGEIVQGGMISLESTGSISHAGKIDVGGDPSGSIQLTANEDVLLESGSTIRALGDSSILDDGLRLGDGGALEIEATTGRIVVNGEIDLEGNSGAEGGTAELKAARDVELLKPISAKGGAEDGGSVEVSAGDRILVRADVVVSSSGGGGSGGQILLSAGIDALGGLTSGGNVDIETGSLLLEGSSHDGFGGHGGEAHLSAVGAISMESAATIKLNAADGFAGDGGQLLLSTTPAGSGGTAPDIQLSGAIRALSGGLGGAGGVLELRAANDIVFDASTSLRGRDSGGRARLDADGALSITAEILVDASSSTGGPGSVEASACALTLTSSGAIDARGSGGGAVSLTGREALAVDTNASVDAGAGGTIELTSRILSSIDTGGITSQFDPSPPALLADPSLPECQS